MFVFMNDKSVSTLWIGFPVRRELKHGNWRTVVSGVSASLWIGFPVRRELKQVSTSCSKGSYVLWIGFPVRRELKHGLCDSPNYYKDPLDRLSRS